MAPTSRVRRIRRSGRTGSVAHPMAGTGPAGIRTGSLSIANDLLRGTDVSFSETPNKGGELSPRYLVFHYTAGRSARSSVDWLTNPEAKASAHLVLGRDGEITQLAPFNIKTWHAGVSQWDGLRGLNSYAIGIEIDNAGPMRKVGDQYQAWFGALYPENEVIYAKHKLDAEFRWWHVYTKVQLELAVELAKLLVGHYRLKDVIGHDDIAPERKRDPGPAFPLDHIRAAVIGRSEEEEKVYRVTATSLNIRSGPGVEFPSVADGLKLGTQVLLLEKRDRWSKIEVVENADIEGWVHNKFLAPL